MDRKAQGFGFISVIFVALFFLIIFSLALAPMVTALLGGANLGILGSGAAWFFSNMNVWYFVAFMIAIVGLVVWGASSNE